MSKAVSTDKSSDTLPRWDLSKDFYNGPDDPRIKADMESAAADIKRFAEKYHGKVAGLSGNALASAISEYESIQKKADHPLLYADLLHSTSLQDEAVKRLVKRCEDEAAKMFEPLAFWDLELGAMEQKSLEDKYRKSEALHHYKPYIENVRRFKDHRLSETEERLLTRIAPVGPDNWPSFLAEERTRLKFTISGETVDEERLGSLRSDPSEEIRRQVVAEGKKVYNPDTAFMRLAAKSMNMVIADKAIEDGLRNYPQPISYRNLSNNIEDEVVDTMVKTVQRNYSRTSHRYNKLKAQIMGTEKLAAHDEFAPPPASTHTIIPWEEAKRIVLESYHEFSPEMAKYAQRMFDKGYIDAQPREGKRGGAFAMPPAGKVEHPFLLMNYQGKPDDVMTLAHELGHNIHQWLAYETQGSLMESTPITLSETASTFGEELVFEKLMKRIKNPAERKALLMEKIEAELGTVERQVQFVAFEHKAHEKRRKEGELGIKDFSAIWGDEAKKRAGPDFIPSETAEYGWARIPHIYSTPFYVYSYAFGESLVAAMFEAWREGKIDNFDSKYIEMLKAGGTKHHKELLAPMGLDASRPDFWQKGAEVRSRHIDELEKLVEHEKTGVKSLEGMQVSGQQGQYTITSSRRKGESPDEHAARMQSVAESLKEMGGDSVTVSRGIIKVNGASGLILQKLNAMGRSSQLSQARS